MIHEGPWGRGSQNKGNRGSRGLSQLSHYAEALLWRKDPGNLKQKEDLINSGNMSPVYVVSPQYH